MPRTKRPEGFTVEPYLERDGIRNLSGSFMARLYRRLKEDGTADMIFYDGHVRDETSFVKTMKHAALCWVVFKGSGPVFMVWVDGLQSRWGQLHFAAFSNIWGKESVEVGRWITDRVLHLQDVSGNYIFDALMGLCPLRNEHACAYLDKVGAKTVGTFPNGVWMANAGRSEDAKLVSYTREML